MNQKIEEVIEAIRKVDRRVAQIMAEKRRGEKTRAQA
jgi:phage shock protein A